MKRVALVSKSLVPIFASGVFGVDFTQNSLLATYRLDLLHFPKTIYVHCTGDAIKMAEAIGAKTIDLEWVPTPMPKSSSSRQKRSAELVVLSLMRTETVLPKSWEGGTT